MADFELQRKNMVESQVRPNDITDRRIIRAMQALPRERFAADDTRPIAYMDQDLPVGARSGRNRRALLAPRIAARLVQLLEIESEDRVLEIGAATGYTAAVMAQLARTVIALEADEALAAAARANLAAVGAGNVSVVSGPHSAGWRAEAPFAAILVSGAVPEIGAALLDQLQDGGRLAVVIGQGGTGHVMQWKRIGTTFASRRIMEAGAGALPGFEKAAGFAF